MLLVTLDVKNAFNSMRWNNMLEGLYHDFWVLKYLVWMWTITSGTECCFMERRKDSVGWLSQLGWPRIQSLDQTSGMNFMTAWNEFYEDGDAG